MSMCLGLYALGDENLASVLRDPPLVMRVVCPEDPEMEAAARASAGRPGLLARLLGRRAEPAPGVDLVLADGEGRCVDLDKAWHGLHYLLTGTAEGGEPPLDLLLHGGEPVGDVDVGYGPARALTAARVRAAHDALAGVDERELVRRFDPAGMSRADVYPGIWEDDRAEESLAYLLEYASVLREFLATTASAGFGALVTIE